MNTHIILRSLIGAALLTTLPVHADVVGDRLQTYRSQGAGEFSAANGEALWNRKFTSKNGAAERSCASCHTANLREAGTHAVTRKPIDPMAPSVNPERLTETKFIEKWFLRNCKWTLGRECTAQEKGDVLTFIQSR